MNACCKYLYNAQARAASLVQTQTSPPPGRVTHISRQKNAAAVARKHSGHRSRGRGLHPGVLSGLLTLPWLARMRLVFRDLPERVCSLGAGKTAL